MWNALKKFMLVNPMGVFIYTILTKWYFMIALSSLVVVFWVLKGLSDAGILQAAEKIVSEAMSETKSVARYCVPTIADIASFWDCVQHPPQYKADPNEQILQKHLDNIINPENIAKDNQDNFNNVRTRLHILNKI